MICGYLTSLVHSSDPLVLIEQSSSVSRPRLKPFCPADTPVYQHHASPPVHVRAASMVTVLLATRILPSRSRWRGLCSIVSIDVRSSQTTPGVPGNGFTFVMRSGCRHSWCHGSAILGSSSKTPTNGRTNAHQKLFTVEIVAVATLTPWSGSTCISKLS